MKKNVSIRSAIVSSSLGQYLVFSIAFFSVIVYSRLLTPTEVGVYAIASSIAMLASEIQLLGTTSYLIRLDKLTKTDVQSGIGLTMLICWGIGLLFFFTANIIGDYYDTVGLSHVIQILSLSFLFAPFISVSCALLSRDLQFQRLVTINATAKIINLAIGVSLVLLGFSFYSMAIGLVSGAFVQFLMLIKLSTKETSWKPRFQNLLPIVKFGLLTSATNMMRRFGTTAPDLIIGKLGTPADVAIFSRGLGFMNFAKDAFSKGLQPVALPFLSQKRRENGDVNEGYMMATLLMGGVVWPALAVCGVAAFPIIIMLFGDNWSDAAPIASILSIWAILISVHLFSPALLVATHNEKTQFFKQLIVFIITISVILITYQYGLEAVAWGLVFSTLIDAFLTTVIIRLATKLSVLTFFKRMTPNIILMAVCSGITWIIGKLINFQTTEPFLSLLLVGSIIGIVWLIVLATLRHPLFKELQVFKGAILSRLK
jgi:O-antigen/teichoic acid export membrane protein